MQYGGATGGSSIHQRLAKGNQDKNASKAMIKNLNSAHKSTKAREEREDSSKASILAIEEVEEEEKEDE